MHLAFLVVTVFLALGHSEEVKEEEGVLVLTNDNFDGVIGGNQFVLVEFYAPWCGHCKALAPEYAKAAKQLKDEGADPKLGKVDATVETKLAEKFKVQGYPTLKFFKNGNPVEYQGGRTATEIVNWLKKKTGPATTVLATGEEAEKFTASADVVVVAHFVDGESESAKIYVSVADGIDDVPFGVISDAEVAKGLAMTDKAIVLFKQFDEERMTYEGKIDQGDITNFIKANQLPLVSEFTQESAPKIFGGTITTHNLLFIKKSDESFKKIFGDFKKAAVEFKGQVLFIYIDADTQENQRVMEFFGLKAENCPDYRIIKMSEDMAKYKPDTKDVSTESIISFTRKVVNGEAKRHLNTEDIPDDWDKNPVTVLVGKNFREVALDANRKVFVEFYAPWCGHCKQLTPIYEELGKKYADRDDVVIAKMDATANEVEEVKVSGFPTLKYFPDDKEENILDYNGERTLEAMAKFIDSDGKDAVGATEDDDLSEEEIEEEEEDQEQEEVDASSAEKRDEL